MCYNIYLKSRIWMWNMDKFLIKISYFVMLFAFPHYAISRDELKMFRINISCVNWPQHQRSTDVSKNLGTT